MSKDDRKECCHCENVASGQFQFPIEEASGELVEGATCKEILQVQNEGNAKHDRKECCQCGSVASCQFQFPIEEAA